MKQAAKKAVSLVASAMAASADFGGMMKGWYNEVENVLVSDQVNICGWYRQYAKDSIETHLFEFRARY